MIYRGQQVTVRLLGGDTVSGWVYAESPLGIYVALDRAGANVRFIPSKAWDGASYAYDDVVEFHGTPDDLYRRRSERYVSDDLLQSAHAALQRIDYNAMRRLYARLAEDASHFRGWYSEFVFAADNEGDTRTLSDVAVSVRLLYSELLDELERSGLDRVLQEHGDEIRELIGSYGLPDFDLIFAPGYEDERRFIFEALIATARERDLVRELDLGRRVLYQVTNSDLVLLSDTEEREAEDEPSERPSEAPRCLRKASAVGKMAVGGALAAANVTAGVFAGIIAALPTLGIGTVAGAVTVVTSAYTGLNAACDGLKDLATAIEKKS